MLLQIFRLNLGLINLTLCNEIIDIYFLVNEVFKCFLANLCHFNFPSYHFEILTEEVISQTQTFSDSLLVRANHDNLEVFENLADFRG